VLEDAPVSLFLDVLQIIPGCPARGIFLAHVAETAGELSQLLAVRTLAQPLDLEVIGLQKLGAREKSQDRFCIVQRLSVGVKRKNGN
jgi:hypothetical protein